jgi:3-deoxy-D-manno-octulosonate 8-phosphate phosphatase (KDO 8-P phosphatase)
VRTVIVIPARLRASRLPNKPLANLGGLPLVVRVARQAQKVRGAHTVIVATDDSSIYNACAKHEIRAQLTSPAHPSGTDRVAEIARSVEGELFLNVQGDEPFIEPRDLDDLIAAMAGSGADMGTLWAPGTEAERSDPNVVKVVLADDGRALYFSRAPIPWPREGGETPLTRKHVGVYAYRRAALERLVQLPVHPLEACEKLEQLRALAAGMHILTVEARTRARGIDTPEDLRWAEERVANLGEAAFP